MIHGLIAKTTLLLLELKSKVVLRSVRILSHAISILHIGCLLRHELIWVIESIVFVHGRVHCDVKDSSSQIISIAIGCLSDPVALDYGVRSGQSCLVVFIVHDACIDCLVLLRCHIIIIIFDKLLFWVILNRVVQHTLTVSIWHLMHRILQESVGETRNSLSLVQLGTVMSIWS